MSPQWQIELLGGLRAVRGDQIIARFRSQKTGALLAFLAFHLTPHPRDLLVDLLWPEEEVASARMRLRTALSALRRQLEPPGFPAGAVIVADRRFAGLNPAAVATDVARFEAALHSATRAASDGEKMQRLSVALELYRGPLLPAYSEPWILPQQQRLGEQFMQAARELIASLEASGDPARALEVARRAVSVDPLHEGACEELFRLSATCGQPGVALRHYHCPTAERTPRAAPEPRPDSAASAGDQPRGSLPLPVTRFFGREREMGRLRQLLREEGVRVVTLTGPGGSGKTRLALEAAARLRDALDDAVWFVFLADVADPRRIIDAVHTALALPRRPRIETGAQVVEVLSRRPSLLVLDNLEHLLPGAMLFLRDLLEQVPLLQCLVTSRQILELAPEREIAVGPLPLPDARRQMSDASGAGAEGQPLAGAPSSLASDIWRLASIESVALFVDRAQRVKPDFQLTRRNAATVVGICRQLEGIPLALELAAARVWLYSPPQMLAQLAHRFDLLVSHRRDFPPRHQTLRAAVDWSYHLLPAELQRFFARLSVFRGGFDLEAAAEVGEATAPAGLLTRLQGSSFVLGEEAGERRRFRILETLREYGAEQLTAGELEKAQRRHAQYYRKLAQRDPSLLGEWLDELETELGNLRAALEWAERSGEIGEGLQLAVALAGFWRTRGYLSEGQERLARLLRAPGGDVPDPLRARALAASGWLAHRRGQFETARPLLEEALATYRQLADRRGIAECVLGLGNVASHQGDFEVACRYQEESLAIHQELGDPGNIAVSMNNLGLTRAFQGLYDPARHWLEAAMAINGRIGDEHGCAINSTNLGLVALRQGRLDEAATLYTQSTEIRARLKDPDGLPYGLEGLAELAVRRGQMERAVLLFAAADALRQEVGHPRCPPSERENDERLLALARSALGSPRSAAAWQQGHTWRMEEAVIYALSEGSAAGAGLAPEPRR